MLETQDVKKVARDVKKSITGAFSKGFNKVKQNINSKRDLLDISDDSGLVPDDIDTLSIRRYWYYFILVSNRFILCCLSILFK